MSNKKVWVDAMKSFSLITQIGMTAVICIFGCGFVGIFIDKKIGTSPVFSIIFIVLGILSAFLSIYKTLKSYIGKRK
ncbi:AtpZ/AtpI family protein [Peptostreptococcus faecalis]|uniref:AtpZ/AtpI family protein n=1 Tax=Peptostreptococcus faecalis TaxID=2045015 RepID=UPI000C7981DB|nr:AtpZ/AtpI family protein [Peptostreptococcus faecalis]